MRRTGRGKARCCGFTPADTVGVALEALTVGQMLDLGPLVARDPIPAGHEIALGSLERGTVVTKLGAAIGRASTDIPAGAHVHRHNLLALAAPGPSRAHPRAAPPAQSLANHFPGFLGYPRPDGRVGTRNMLIVLPTVNCSATVARRIAPAFRGRLEAAPHPGIDGVAALCHAQGCSVRADGPGMAMLRRVLGGLRRAS